MPIILTSNGLTSQPIIDRFIDFRETGSSKAAVVITADPDYRTQNRRAVHTKNKLSECGFDTIFFDLDFSPAEHLDSFDLVFFSGGNPFYLLSRLRSTNAKSILEKMLSQDKFISGSSAGAIALGTTLKLVAEFDPQLNHQTNLHDLSGLGLTTINICPHYAKYSSLYADCEKRIYTLEVFDQIVFNRINDGEAIEINNGDILKITGQELT